MELAGLLDELEWYDNHKLSHILSCKRKAYFHIRHPWTTEDGTLAIGIDAGVGDGARAGSVIHAAQGVYYSKHTLLEEPHRRMAAFRAAARIYRKLFLDEPKEPGKHSLQRLLDIIDQYFDRYLEDDRLFEPVETELFFLIRIEPEPGDPPHFLVPFWYCGRCDGVWWKRATGELLVLETKTTSWSVERQLTRMKINRQQAGYIYSLRQNAGGEQIVGAMPNIVLVAPSKVEFKRDYVVYSLNELLSWRRQTINIVQDWRLLIGRTDGMPVSDRLDHFYQNDEECTSYGMCPFHRLCYEGLHTLPQLPVHETTWTPLGGGE